MSYKKNNNSTAIMVSVSVIALVLASMSGFNHSYTAFAAPKKGGSSSTGHTNGVTTLGGGGSSSSSSAATTSPNNSNVLTKKELSSFTSCIKTANSSQGLTHKIVTGCLDTARGITPASSSTGTATSSPSSIAPSTTSTS
jgi:hypothetical protein